MRNKNLVELEVKDTSLVTGSIGLLFGKLVTWDQVLEGMRKR